MRLIVIERKAENLFSEKYSASVENLGCWFSIDKSWASTAQRKFYEKKSLVQLTMMSFWKLSPLLLRVVEISLRLLLLKWVISDWCLRLSLKFISVKWLSMRAGSTGALFPVISCGKSSCWWFAAVMISCEPCELAVVVDGRQ